MSLNKNYKIDICIVGGLGHVGLPLGIKFAEKKLKVCLYDINKENSSIVKNKKMPFIEYGAEKILSKVINNGNLYVSNSPNDISLAKYVFITIGTPIDEYLNPKTKEFLNVISKLKKYFNKNQIIIVRSSVFPNVCQQILNILKNKNKDDWNLAYCPERIVQGYAIKELNKLPQIISGFNKKSISESKKLFNKITKKIIVSSIKEAELSKLFCNSLRYIEFAIANQFYMISEDFGVDFDEVRKIMTYGYDRAKMLPTAGFSAGPCLLKDTMQLHSFNHNNFLLGQASMIVNEGLPNFIIKRIKQKYNIQGMNIGILGMSFKANIDDIRDSLSFKLKKNLILNNANVFCSDEFVRDKSFIDKNNLIKKCKIIIIGTPHSAYAYLKIPKSKKIIDLWGITKKNNL